MGAGQQVGKHDTPIFTGLSLLNAAGHKTTLLNQPSQLVDQTLTLPIAHGSANQVLADDGTGVLGFIDVLPASGGTVHGPLTVQGPLAQATFQVSDAGGILASAQAGLFLGMVNIDNPSLGFNTRLNIQTQSADGSDFGITVINDNNNAPMVLSSDGFMGVGWDAPTDGFSARLDVHNALGPEQGIRLTNNDDGYSFRLWQDDSLNVTGAGFGTQNSYVGRGGQPELGLCIDTLGQVGVGLPAGDSPNAKLHVNGDFQLDNQQVGPPADPITVATWAQIYLDGTAYRLPVFL